MDVGGTGHHIVCLLEEPFIESLLPTVVVCGGDGGRCVLMVTSLLHAFQCCYHQQIHIQDGQQLCGGDGGGGGVKVVDGNFDMW